MTRTGIGTLALLALITTTATGGPLLPLDLIPDQACIGIAIRDLADLKAKGDALARDRPGLPRFSELFDHAFRELDLGWAVDEKKPAALVCAAGKLAGYADDADMMSKFQISAVVPFKKRDDVLTKWKLQEGDLAMGKPVSLAGKRFGEQFGISWGGFREEQVYLSGTKGSLTALMEAKTLRQVMPAERAKRFDSADGLFYFGPPLLKFAAINVNTDYTPTGYTEKEAEAYRRVSRSIREARNVLAAYWLGEGISLDLGFQFDPAGKNSQELLKAFNAPGRTSSLSGLPTGPVVGAFGMIGLDELNYETARILAGEFWNGLRYSPAFLESDTAVVRRVVGDVYGRLKNGSLALYLASGKDAGKIAGVAVLEPRKFETFLKEIGATVRTADDKEFAPMGNAGQAEIAKLVQDLGADDFDLREGATTKLGLIGAPALDALKAAEKSTDAEVRRRASELRSQIEAVAQVRKKENAGGLLRQAFHPTFSWKADAEERAGVKVSHLMMRFESPDAPYAALFREYLGPEWNRVRLAAVNGKIVALVGSDVALFDQTIANVRENKPGLEASPALAEFHKQAGPNRRVEFHAAVDLLRSLTSMDVPPKGKPSMSLTSIALNTGASEVNLEFRAPRESVGSSLWWFGW